MKYEEFEKLPENKKADYVVRQTLNMGIMLALMFILGGFAFLTAC